MVAQMVVNNLEAAHLPGDETWHLFKKNFRVFSLDYGVSYWITSDGNYSYFK